MFGTDEIKSWYRCVEEMIGEMKCLLEEIDESIEEQGESLRSEELYNASVVLADTIFTAESLLNDLDDTKGEFEKL